MGYRKLIIVLAIGLCWIGRTKADEKEDRAVAVVKKLLGEIQRDETRPDKPVMAVDLSRTNVTDAVLKELTPLTRLTILNLSETSVSDAGLKDIISLKGLTTIDLTHTEVADAGLKELAKLKELTTLYLSQTKVTDEGLKELASLTELTYLDLDGTEVTDRRYRRIAERHSPIARSSDSRACDRGELQPDHPRFLIRRPPSQLADQNWDVRFSRRTKLIRCADR